MSEYWTYIHQVTTNVTPKNVNVAPYLLDVKIGNFLLTCAAYELDKVISQCFHTAFFAAPKWPKNVLI